MQHRQQKEEVERLKKDGNLHFQKKQWEAAIECYTRAIHVLDRAVNTTEQTPAAVTVAVIVEAASNESAMMRATLLSNRSLCRMQRFDEQKSITDTTDLEQVIRDCTLALQILASIHSTSSSSSSTNASTNASSDTISHHDKAVYITTSSIRTLRSKLLYRRAKANNAKSSLLPNRYNDTDITQNHTIQAIQDLHDLLSFDPNNQLAHSLLQSIRQFEIAKQQNCHNSHDHIHQLSSSLSSSSSPIQRALYIICNYYCHHYDNDSTKNSSNAGCYSKEIFIQSLQFLHTSFVDDLISTSQQLLSFHASVPTSTLSASTSPQPTTTTKTTTSGLMVLYNLAFLICKDKTQLIEHDTLLLVFEYQALSMQIINEACTYLPIMKQLHDYHSQQLKLLQQHQQQQQGEKSSLSSSSSSSSSSTQSFVLSFILLNNIHCTLDQDKNNKDNHDNVQKHLDKYIQSSMSFYIRYILYMYIQEDNNTYQSVSVTPSEENKGEEEEEVTMSTSCSSSRSYSNCSNDSTSLLVQYLFSIIIKIFSSFVSFKTSSSLTSSTATVLTPFICLTASRSLLHAILTDKPQVLLEEIRKMYTHYDSSLSSSSSSKKKPLQILFQYPIPSKSTNDIQTMKPRELALYRRRQYAMKQHQIQRCKQHVISFCSNQWDGMDVLMTFGLSRMMMNHNMIQQNKDGTQVGSHHYDLDDAFWRREIMTTISKIIKCFLLDNKNGLKSDNTGKEDGQSKENIYELRDEDLKQLVIDKYFGESLTIEVIDDELDDESGDKGHRKGLLKKSFLCTSLLLADSDLGTWVLTTLWSHSKADWISLVLPPNNSNADVIVDNEMNHISLSVASELASAAAGVESTRSWVKACTCDNDGKVWQVLLSSNDQEVRSGAASAMAKLGLADKTISSDEGELIALLEVAGGLVSESVKNSKHSSPNTNSSLTQLERGVELLSYLSSKTSIKDEISHGYTIRSLSNKSCLQEKSLLEDLVELANDDDGSLEIKTLSSSILFGLSSIFSSLAVSIETLRKEAFADKEITMEQYDQLQSMGKTAEEKELEENSKVDSDNPEAVLSRIRIMAEKGVCNALVHLIKRGASAATLEQLLICMMRMASEQSVRGKMIQAGCLSECINVTKMEKDKGQLSELEQKITRLAKHTVGKLLVTTNPALLTTSQRMGAVKPLISLVKDSEATDLQRFEALLSLTNLAGYGDDTKQRIISERGIAVLSYAMFSDHEMVRRAATEAMSNLVPHPDVMKYFRDPEKLKLWVAFASDFMDNYECSRAALGCIAMITRDSVITEEFCKLKNSRKMLESVLSSGRLELMHRILVAVLNILDHKKSWIVSSGTLAFCKAYVEKYHNKELAELEFSNSETQLFMITLDIAKEVVKISTDTR